MTDDRSALNRLALGATLHCFTGCAIGEVLGLAIATALGWQALASVALAVSLAFAFGYALSLRPLLAAGLSRRHAARLALVADTFSITTMEIVDNALMLAIPGAMAASLGDVRFWWAMALSLAVAFVAAYPVNRALIARGRGHAVVHDLHHGAHGAHGR